MLKSLTTTHFQKLGSQTFSFTDGLNLVVGPNWVGKSSLIRAILYALGGPTLAGLKADHLIAWGQPSMEVSLEIGELTITRGTSRATLHCNGELIASGQTAVTAEIGTQLGLPVKQWGTFYVTRQGEASELLSASSTKLTGFINEATGIDVVDRVIGQCKEDVTRLTGAVEAVGDLDGELAHLNDTLAALGHQLAQGLGHLDLLTQQAVVATSDLVAAQQIEAQVRQQFAEWDRYHRELLHHVGQLREANDRLEQLEAPVSEGSVARRDALRQQLSELSEQRTLHRIWGDAVREHERTIARAEQTIADLRGSSPQGVVVDFTGLDEQSAGTHRLGVPWAVTKREQAVCPTCQRPLDGQQEARAENDWITQHAENLAQWEAYLGKLTAARQSLLDRPVDYDEQVEIQTGQALRLEDQLISDWTQYRAERTAAEGQINRCNERLAALVKVPEVKQEQVDACVQAVTTAQAKVVEIGTRKATAEAVQAGLLAQQSSLHLQREGIQARVERYQADAKRLELVKRLRKYLTDNRDRFLTEIWNQILSFASDFVSSATRGEISRLTRTPEGGFSFVENGHETPIEVASGMQEAILGVALKLSLGAALGGSSGLGGVMLFDEVTSAGSDENALLVTGLLAGVGQQVVMVSHREADAAVAASVILL